MSKSLKLNYSALANVLFSVTIYLIFVAAALLQTTEAGTGDYEVFDRNGISKEEIVHRMSLDVSMGDRGYLQLDPNVSQFTLDLLERANIAKAQEAAVQPFFNALCEEMKAPNPDVIRAATIVDDGMRAEADVIEYIYDIVMASLPDEKFLDLQSLLDNTVGFIQEQESWKARAELDPATMKAKLSRMCVRIESRSSSDSDGSLELPISLD